MAQHFPSSSRADTLQTPPSSKIPGHSTGRSKKRPRDADSTPVDSISKRTRRAIKEANIPPKEISTNPSLSKERTIEKSGALPLSPHSPHHSEIQNPQISDTPCTDIDPPNIKLSPVRQSEEKIAEVASANAGKRSARSRGSPIDSVSHWVLEGHWPEDHFIEEYPIMDPPLTKKRSRSTVKDQSQSTITDKEKDYRSAQIEVLMETVNIYIKVDPRIEPSQSCKDFCVQMLRDEQEIPKKTLFEDDTTFRLLMARVEAENETVVFRDLTPLIAPAAELLYLHGAENLGILHGHSNMSWGRSIPLVASPPQPDYCVGLGTNAFTSAQWMHMRALIRGVERNPLMATWRMWFPFFMCEAKATGGSLVVANRQNMASGSVAVNALVTLYRAAGRERELHRKIVAFSISHDPLLFQIHGHFASFEETEPRFYRYPIKTALIMDSQDRWAAYRFTRNLYDVFAPLHLERITSVLDSLPADATIWGGPLAPKPSQVNEWDRPSTASEFAESVIPSTPALEDGS
ncbi:MAG: hypothetical protein HETSPECPRED_000035 [Heterodermia speciosa]|uniref:DUF7924 domain-containing protein n=1 Tax=Heterodermia speciosa TaxID=116794 RepID=A0A8H3EH17_9LECA|nr:MAG: hypothetical protein HETSPECPRED_000035 [Heterodermia speciosa]